MDDIVFRVLGAEGEKRPWSIHALIAGLLSPYPTLYSALFLSWTFPFLTLQSSPNTGMDESRNGSLTNIRDDSGVGMDWVFDLSQLYLHTVSQLMRQIQRHGPRLGHFYHYNTVIS